jgi:UDP-N-acetylglucosamine--N-acetylmuramyl-(pentapeptide) pyrophosphoryl-undecaprenol N-acetylglucosamine transferase
LKRETIVFQPPNHIGLGHISRLLAIALAVRELDPRVRLPFVVGGHAHGLLEAHEVFHLALPLVRDGQVLTSATGWENAELHRIARDLAAAMMHTLAPDLVVFDCFPNEVVLDVVRARRLPVVICLRKSRQMAPFFEAIRHHGALVRAILIPHPPGECEIPADLLPKTHFTGPITRPFSLDADAPSRQRGNADERPSRRQVIVTGGGGGYPGTVEFYNLALDACARVRETVPARALDILLVAGPLFTHWTDLQLPADVRVIPFDPHLSARLGQADTVICQGGYNTMAELVALGVPAICVPAERGSDDQFERARTLAAEHTQMQTYEGSDGGELATLIVRGLETGRTRTDASTPSTSSPGAQVAARLLVSLLRTRTAAHA